MLLMNCLECALVSVRHLLTLAYRMGSTIRSRFANGAVWPNAFWTGVDDMKREFSRKELYELLWSQPTRTVAAQLGLSDVALAKQCKKANIPLPSRGYWARRQAGKPTIKVTLPPRFPGASDRLGGFGYRDYYYGADWPQKFLEMPIPPIPTFDEDMSSVTARGTKMVGKIRCSRKFEPAHPLVKRLLGHDEERRQEYAKWGSSYYAPRYDTGIERRRLLIINALFLPAARLGCRPSMSTSKYGQDAHSERQLSITVGESHIYFTLEPFRSKKEPQTERLKLGLGMARDRATPGESWEDEDERPLEDRLTDILVGLLVTAEANYRDTLAQTRNWVIERKAAAEAELKKREAEAERKARELEAKVAGERIGRLLSQAKALDRANQIRAYVEAAASRASELPVTPADFDNWALWARREADRIDPLVNGTIVQAINERSKPADETARSGNVADL